MEKTKHLKETSHACLTRSPEKSSAVGITPTEREYCQRMDQLGGSWLRSQPPRPYHHAKERQDRIENYIAQILGASATKPKVARRGGRTSLPQLLQIVKEELLQV